MTKPKSIAFSQIPSNLEVPGSYLEFNAANANNGTAAASYRYLVMGQMLSSGSAAPLVPVRILSGKAQADAAFGQGSMLSNMIAAAVNANDQVELWAMPVVDNNAGVAATGAIAFSGTATGAGTITAYIGYSDLISPAQIAVSAGQTAAQIATALAAAINAVLDLPVTAAVDGTANSKVDITARHKGIEAGQIDIRLAYPNDVLPTGITATITAMSGGAANPLPTPIISALADVRYDVIACPWNDATTYAAWYSEAARRWNALVARDVCIVTAFHGSQGALATLLASMNSPWHDCYGSANALTPSFVEAAALGAVYCTNLQKQPNAPQKGTVVPGVKAPMPADQFLFSQRQVIYLEGGALWTANSDGTVSIEKAVTTYKTNASGAADTSYHGRWVPATLSYLRQSWNSFMSSRFSNCTFADDGTPVVGGEVTPTILANATITWFQQMMALGLVQDLGAFKASLVSIRNVANHARNDQLLAPALVPPLDVIAGQMAFTE